MESLSLEQAFFGAVVSGLIVFMTRLLPFVIFGRRKPPKFIGFIERYTPSLIIAVLIVYCFKDVSFCSVNMSVPYVAAAACVCALHLVFDNSLVSIGGGTVIFMILSRLL